LSQNGPRHEGIYGDDDRLDLYQTGNPKLLALADSTVALFENKHITREGGKAALKTNSYSEEYSLCPEEPFYSQRTGAFCSGSLVGPDLVMTAGHCMTYGSSCKNTSFVFGFGIREKDGKTPQSVPESEVYGCKELIAHQVEGNGADWALARLERPVAGHKPLAINRTGKIEAKTLLFVIGHPAGLPTKIAGGATVRDPAPAGYFVANLDTYGGNSGSAVFNAQTGLVEGILVRGEDDYVWRGGCQVSKRCENNGCRGEDVTKISALASLIPLPGPAMLVRRTPPGTIARPRRLMTSLQDAFILFDGRR
jgi:V8-like Glu-specific endopeptidase